MTDPAKMDSPMSGAKQESLGERVARDVIAEYRRMFKDAFAWPWLQEQIRVTVDRLAPAPRLSPEEARAAAIECAAAVVGHINSMRDVLGKDWRVIFEPILSRLSRAGTGGKWTKEPKEPGQYWMRAPGRFAKPHVVRLFHYDEDIGAGLFVASQGDEITDPIAKWEGCEFLGPIPVPEE